ncbi:MAG: hypothetical protein ACYC3X_08245 [Pirellulaceae bacterium]
MSIVADLSPCDMPFSLRPAEDQQVHERVREIVRQHRPRPEVGDRRCDRREPFPYPIHVTPVADDGSILKEETFVVLGKHLSERGLDFYYEAPLPYRRVITSWECHDGNWLALLLDLRWCRSTRHGWYENGGRFLQVVPSPLSEVGETRPAEAS